MNHFGLKVGKRIIGFQKPGMKMGVNFIGVFEACGNTFNIRVRRIIIVEGMPKNLCTDPRQNKETERETRGVGWNM